MRLAAILFALATTVSLAAAQSAAIPPTGAWGERSRSAEFRSEAATAVVNGKLYLMGGLARGQESHTLTQEFDLATNMWRERAPMPGPLSHPAAVTLNGKIYVVGGFLAQVHAGAQNAAYEYDPAADRWRTLAQMKGPRGSVALVVANGRIHAIGGRNPDRKTLTIHEIYDPAANRWTEAAPLPQPRDHLFVAFADGKIHVIGGRVDTPVDNVARHDIYDVASDTWTSGPPLPTPRSGGAAVVLKGVIVVAGGECNNLAPFDTVEGFDLKTGRWRTLAPMPVGKHGINAATDGQTMYIGGGNPECGMSFSDRLITFTLP
jgi:N-acetylneuraminic acid mutarotase